MYLSVRVERVSELPNGQQVAVEYREDGRITYFIQESHITPTGAEALQVILSTARDAYHQAWSLPMPIAALAH